MAKLSVQNPTDLIQSATVNFNGLAPDGVLSSSSGGYTWAAGVNQGLIAPLELGITESMRVLRLQLFMVGHDTWRIELLDGTSVAVLRSGTTETSFTAEGVTFLSNGQKLRVITTGAGTSSVKMVCTLVSSYVFSPAPVSTQVEITGVTVTASENMSQVGGTAVDVGNGIASPGSQRMVIASDNTPFPIKIDLTTPGTTNAISVAQVGANTVLVGNGESGLGSQRVTVASNNTPFPVKIDQTTPGTTNLVATDANATIKRLNGEPTWIGNLTSAGPGTPVDTTTTAAPFVLAGTETLILQSSVAWYMEVIDVLSYTALGGKSQLIEANEKVTMTLNGSTEITVEGVAGAATVRVIELS